MHEVTETQLPGVGLRHEFTTSKGQRVAVVSRRGGRREIVVYDQQDPDASSTVLALDADDAQTLAELLGALHIAEALVALQRIQGHRPRLVQRAARVPGDRKDDRRGSVPDPNRRVDRGRGAGRRNHPFPPTSPSSPAMRRWRWTPEGIGRLRALLEG